MPNSLIENVERTIQRHKMLQAGDRVLVALSGGPDSICLLNVLEQLAPRYPLTICVAHFDHRLREEASERDARFAKRIAGRKGLAFATSSADVAAYANEHKFSLEDAGRRLRYEFLQRVARSFGSNKVAVGHTADDQAETVLMRLIRGAGPRGLAGIPPVRRLGGPAGPEIIRPLIEAWRADIMRYLRTRKLSYQKDCSNESAEFLRNKIRLELIPKLEKEYNPRIKHRLAGAALALAAENDFIESEARLLAEVITIEKKPSWVVFDAVALGSLHPALRNRIALALARLAKRDVPMIETLHYEQADALIRSGGGRLDLPGGLRLEISEGVGLISEMGKQPAKIRRTFEVPLGGAVFIHELNLRVKTRILSAVKSPFRLARMCTPNRQYFDLDAVRLPLEVRLRRRGDSFRPLGSRGSKKLKDFFIDKKTPRFLRDSVPLLLSGGKIMWVMGHAIDEKYKLKPGSGAALRVDYE